MGLSLKAASYWEGNEGRKLSDARRTHLSGRQMLQEFIPGEGAGDVRCRCCEQEREKRLT